MIRNLAIDETGLAVRETVFRRLTNGLAPSGSAPVEYLPAWRALAELAVLAIALSESEGGLGGGVSDTMPVLESIGRSGVAVPFLDGICGPLALASYLPHHTVLSRYLAEATAGGRPVAFAWIEPGQGWKREPVRTVAHGAGDAWRVTGLKSAVMWAGEASAVIVTAICEGETAVFLVPSATPGVSLSPCRTADGHRAADVVLANVLLEPGNRLDTGGADEAVDFAIDAIAALSLAEAVGAMDACLDMTTEYLKTREQFGVPLSRQQALQHRLAEMYADCETAWSMAVDAATTLHPGMSADERRMRVSAAKAHVGSVGRRVALEALQMHGAIGMTMEYGLGRLISRITLIDLSNGDTQWHLARLSRLLEGKS